jgi:hypothetical protein
MQEDGVVLGAGLAIGIAGLAYTAAVTGAAYHIAKAALTSLFGL